MIVGKEYVTFEVDSLKAAISRFHEEVDEYEAIVELWKRTRESSQPVPKEPAPEAEDLPISGRFGTTEDEEDYRAGLQQNVINKARQAEDLEPLNTEDQGPGDTFLSRKVMIGEVLIYITLFMIVSTIVVNLITLIARI
jgi:hypothetical protein